MPSSSSESLSQETSGEVLSTKKSKHKEELKVSERLNSIITQRDYISLLLMSMVQLPKLLLLVNTLHKHGNGAFYFTYLFILLVVGMPVLFMEVFLGQYTRQVSLLAWKMSPISNGVFMYLHIIIFVFTFRNGTIGSRLWWYIYKGVTMYDRGFPWSVCQEQKSNVKCYNASSDKLSHDCKAKGLFILCPGNLTYQLAETQYFQNEFLSGHSSYEIEWNVLACFAFYWLVVLLFLLKKSFYPKLSLYTLCLFFAVIILLLLHVIFEFEYDAASMGKFFHVEADKLFNTSTWFMAFIHTYLGLMLNSPAPFAFSTCVRFKSNPAIHILIVTFIYILLELFAVALSYAIVGIIAKDMNISTSALQSKLPIDTIFWIYPHFLNKLALGKMWTAVYFITAVLSAVVNQVIIISGVVYSITTCCNLQRYRVFLVTMYCGLSFLLSIPLSTQIGQSLISRFYRLFLFRGLIIGFALETMTVFWSYGISRLSDDIYFMCGAKPSSFWTTTWELIPIVGLSVMIYSVTVYEGDFMHPELHTAYTLGFNISLAVVCSIVLVGAGQKVVKYAKEHDLSGLFQPTFEWGPPNKLLRKARKRFYPDKYIPSQPLSAYNTSSTSWRLVKEEIKAAHLLSRTADNTDRSRDDKRAKTTRKTLFF